ncbi:protein SODIUM POTASSIUM ROOT DEFECTIVE 2-like [Diospyros lotus]|uniref:protein SODIUM POTASSIUM ROOT DEFECTIVE 2-like n=1 Tax=Diospyros lotus TaxID=55363 RepID=UPI0022538359|nr:protein SODIUM POTASSIUM ROOT DEFECTIVE 2-like [Diospyros lotus]
MNTKSTRMKMKMGGLMCQSQAATAVCVPADPRSVIAPQAEHAKLINSSVVRYARLVDHRRRHHHHHSRRFSSADHDKMRSSTPARRDVKAIQKPPPPMASSTSTEQVFQVVVMRVSLHCQGCAGKVKKHISKMEGVTSFSIDLESKRVTVMGHVSPAGVLESVSKVKRAELWSS